MKIKEAIKILQVAKAEIEWTAPLEYQEAIDMAIEALEKQIPSDTSSHDEKHILQGCIALIGEMVGGFREYLDFIDHEPEFEEEKMPFTMTYFHIVQRLFLWSTRHSGGTSTMKKCYELGIEDSSKNIEFYLWEDKDE